MPFHPVKLISSAIEHQSLPCEPINEVCAVTGLQGPSIPRKELFGASFTNIDLLAVPDSSWVSVDAFQALKYKWERMSSWMCDGNNFMRLDRVGVRNLVLAEDMPDIWIGYATTSYKKHGSLRTPINTGRMRQWLFEMQIVDCTDMTKVSDYWYQLNYFLRKGISRSLLESMQCPPYLMRKIGYDLWSTFERWARNKYRSPLYQFICYLLPSQKELKNEV